MNRKYSAPTVLDGFTSQFMPSEKYESEAALEDAMIKALCTVGYEFVDIHDSTEIMNNLRIQMEALNDTKFSDREWELIQNNYLLRSNDSPVISKTQRFQVDYRFSFVRDDDSLFNFKIVDKDDIGKNKLQVIHQYVAEDGLHVNRYDVTVLCNGLPVVHVELKRRGVNIREAFDQIRRYGRESFWAGNKLFEYVQIFVISNGTITKYYSNTTRYNSIDIRNGTTSPKIVTTCNSFEFTSYWTDSENNHIEDLMDFSVSLLAKDTLLRILTRYCVFNTDNQLLVMRPYQIAASERIISRALCSVENGVFSCNDAGGYIWHTTGSGKTLTSFKTAQLMKDMSEFDKIFFVVDRKDLDYQSMKEFEKFQEGAVNGTTNTKMLKKVMDDDSKKIIVTTIQKLDRFISSYKSHPVYKKRVVIIFDECHRSQFGSMHNAITGAFKNYHLFGFTGTPIFPENATGTITIEKYIPPQTTMEKFGECLHKYTIMDAIRDGNVLRFKVDYVSTVKMKAEANDEQVEDVNSTDLICDPTRMSNIVDYILNNIDAKTHRHESYILGDTHVYGFNSLFAVGSTQMAVKYYDLFRKKIKERGLDLKVATIFTYDPNQEFDDSMSSEDNDSPINTVDVKSGLQRAANDYNVMFDETTNFSIDGNGFGNYYKDISDKMKNKKIDILIVVDMFLTGFDSKALNTLWIDRNLKHHGLIQAFSRTNRILNKVKDHGNVICFRKMKKRVDEAISLFSDKNAGGNIIIRPFDDYYDGYIEPGGKYVPGFVDLVDDLLNKFPLHPFKLETEDDLYEFVDLFGKILRRYNLLTSYDDFTEDKRILNPNQIQNYKSHYLNAYDQVKRLRMRDKVDIRDDVVFEMELMYQNTIGLSYIVSLINGREWGHSDDREFKIDIQTKIEGDVKLRSKVSLIMAFINKVSDNVEGNADWREFVNQRKKAALEKIIIDNNLNRENTEAFVSNAFEIDSIRFDGVEFNDIFPPLSRFDKSVDRSRIMSKVENELYEFFEMYHDVF